MNRPPLIRQSSLATERKVCTHTGRGREGGREGWAGGRVCVYRDCEETRTLQDSGRGAEKGEEKGKRVGGWAFAAIAVLFLLLLLVEKSHCTYKGRDVE